MKRIPLARRAAAVLSVAGLVGSLGACEDLLTVTDRGRIVEPALADSTLVNELGNAAIGTMSRVYGSYAYAMAVFTDEAVSGHNFEQWQWVDHRMVDDSNDTYGQYAALHQLRFSGGDMAARLTTILGEERASRDARVAQSYMVEGYGLLLLAESHCNSPLTGTDEAKSSDEIMALSIASFDKAIAIAAAAGNSAKATSTLNAARVGAARASLNLGNFAKAIEYASAVSTGFSLSAQHSATQAVLFNPFNAAVTGQNFNLGVDPKFQAFNDPRVRFRPAVAGHNPAYAIAAPFSPPSFSDHSATGPGVVIGQGASIRFASKREAEYIVAEAQGPTAANIAFINARRAEGNQTALANDIGVQAFRLAVIDQRSREFYLDGHRIGDLRRMKKLYNVDEFPKGENPNPGARYGEYGTAECFLPTRGERIGNPSI
jgi:hypothetical protein